MDLTIILSAWGAALSTGLAFLTIFDRTRARPIIRAYAQMASRFASEKPAFVTGTVRTGPYNDEQVHEFYVEFRAENHGTKPLSLVHIYIETEKNLSYFIPDGLPVILEGQTSATCNLQKEHFDAFDLETNERIKANVREIGFVDGLDRRYPVARKQLQNILENSLSLPTTGGVFRRKDHPEDRVFAFQTTAPAMIQSRSAKTSGLKRNVLFWKSND